MKNSICAVIVTYNCLDKFYECFNSVYEKVEKVVIVDNGSNKETLEIIKDIERKYDIQLILNNENLGIATALNKGVSYAINNQYDWILTLDHDSKVTENMLFNMLKAYDSLNENEKSKVMSIAPKYIEEDFIYDIN